MTKAANAIIYTRVSTGRQADEGTSLEVQESACLRKAQELGAQVVDVISDEGVSGAFFLSRPGIQKALAMLEAKEASLLITMKLDRSGRDADVLSIIRKRCLNAGGQLVFADGANFENNATGNLLFRVSAGFAEFEKELIRERTLAGKRKRAEQGQQPCRSWSPFGYHIVKKEDVLRGLYPPETIGTYQIVEESAQWVREMYRQYLQGASLRAICRMLQENGIDAPSGGKTWVPISVKYVLENPVYKGEAAYGRNERRVDENRLKAGYKRPDYQVKADSEKWVTMNAPALVDVSTWNAVQERLHTNQSSLGGNPSRRFLLSGLLRCRVCGNSMGGGNCKGTGYYQCSKSRTYRNVTGIVCVRRSRRAEHVEGLIIRSIRFLAERPERYNTAMKVFADKQRASQPTEERDRLHRAIADLTQQEESTAKAQIDALTKGRSTEVYERLLSEIDAQRKQLTRSLSELEANYNAPAPVDFETDAERIAEVLRRVSGVLEADDYTTAEKHALLSTLIKSIVPQGDEHEDGYEVELVPYGETVQRVTTRLS